MILIMKTNAADDDPWYSALSAAFKKHNLEVADDSVKFLLNYFNKMVNISRNLNSGILKSYFEIFSFR